MAGSRKGSRSTGASRARTVSQSKVSMALPTTSGESGTSAASPSPLAPVVAPRRRITLKRALLGVGAVALLLILIGVGYAYYTVQKTLPTTSGTLKLPGLSAPATVTRDIYGVPHIVAANINDLYEAEGYVHAQDRLFQMFFFRAVGEGRLAEYFGPSQVDTDRFLRTVGFRRAAEAEWAQTAPQVRSALEAYSRGVNEFIRTHSDSLPLEFGFLGAKVEEWQPVDTLTFGKVQAWDLTQTWSNDLLTADLLSNLGPDITAELLPGYPKDAPVVVPGANTGSVLPALKAYSDKIRPVLPSFGLGDIGSNNWVVAGSKSTTGKPLLANDPHLGVRSPSIWYQVHLSTTDGKYNAEGFGFAGAPGIITGHNQNISWGVTNVGADVQDVFIEKLDPSGHPGQYASGSSWLPLKIYTETIKVKDGAPITQTVRVTDHGPIISDVLPVTATLGVKSPGPWALQWSGAQPGHLLEAVYNLQTASNWQQFRAALQGWSIPGQNFVYADTQGNIGYQMTGNIPLRKKGDGSVPVPGWTGEYDWNGYIPFDALPRAYNPPEGFVATANNKPYGPDYKYQFRGEWAPPWRISRITELLKAKDKLSIDDFKNIQMDTSSELAKKVGDELAALKPTDAPTQQAAKMFQGWNGDLKPDSAAAAIYEVTAQKALSETYSDNLGLDLFGEYLDIEGSTVLQSFEQLLDKPQDPLWDRKETPQKETRDDILLASLTSAVSDMTGALGGTMQDWQWGQIHTVTPAHPFGSQPVIGAMFNLPSVPIGGDQTTVSVGTFSLVEPFSVSSYQSYRMIIDAGDWSKSLGILAGGESGQPFSKHFSDMLTPWQNYQYNPILYTQQQIEANKESVLTLTP